MKRVSNQWQRAQNDFQRGQMSHDEFSLTDKGVRFLNVMLKKFGEGDDYAGGAGGERSAFLGVPGRRGLGKCQRRPQRG